MQTLLFHLGFAALMTHELDAMARAEWRVLPVTSWMPEAYAFHVFVLAHVPLVAWLTWLLTHPQSHIQARTRTWISAFLVIHVGLHLAFSGHTHYDFHGLMSRALIFGAGVCGAGYLLLDRRGRADRAA